MKTLIIIIGCLFLFFNGESYLLGKETKPIDLVRMCDGREPIPEEPFFGQALCAFYLRGMMDLHSLLTGYTRQKFKFFCLPKAEISGEQAIKIFLRWAEKYPEKLHTSARVSAMLSPSEAFPCNN